jgi:hypothetical protein
MMVECEYCGAVVRDSFITKDVEYNADMCPDCLDKALDCEEKTLVAVTKNVEYFKTAKARVERESHI